MTVILTFFSSNWGSTDFGNQFNQWLAHSPLTISHVNVSQVLIYAFSAKNPRKSVGYHAFQPLWYEHGSCHFRHNRKHKAQDHAVFPLSAACYFLLLDNNNNSREQLHRCCSKQPRIMVHIAKALQNSGF